ncbi:MAG: hypothetical protein HY791_28635 [Deltaproteobacteria bacterium]|nr:hypothetical protein [Deltaproteobacteria bacterium]
MFTSRWLPALLIFTGCAHSTSRTEVETSAIPPSASSGQALSPFEDRAVKCLERASPEGLGPSKATFFLLANMRGRLPAALVFEGFQKEPETEASADQAIEPGLVACLHQAAAFVVEGPAGQPRVTTARASISRASLQPPVIPGWIQSSSKVRVVETWIPWMLGRIEVEADELSEAIGDFYCGPPGPATPQDDDIYLFVEVGEGRARVAASAGLIQAGNPSTGDWHWLGSDRGFTVLTRCLEARVSEWRPAADQWGLLILRARLDVEEAKGP